MKKSIVCFVIAILIAAGGIGYSIYYSQSKDELYQRKSIEYSDLQNQFDVMKKEVHEKRTEINQTLTGFDEDQIEVDTSLIESLLSQVFGWSSYDDYMSIRDKIKEQYNLTDDSEFLSTFMPEPRTIKNKAGKVVWNIIDDNKLNMSYNSIVAYIDSIADDGTWSYIGKVSYSTQDANGYVANSVAYIKYSIKDNAILTIEGYTDASAYDAQDNMSDDDSNGSVDNESSDDSVDDYESTDDSVRMAS